jgi:hypothetical protein
MSKKLAIKGHPTRGKEVIELLEMMGGTNPFTINDGAVIGNKETSCYHIAEDSATKYISWDYIGPEEIDKYEIFTLEEFLKKYPFKIGDLVDRNIDYVSCVIDNMKWDSEKCCVEYHTKTLNGSNYGWHVSECFVNNKTTTTTKKESTMFMQMGKTVSVIFNSENYEDEVELQLGDYEIAVRDGKTYAIRKKPTYPKTVIEVLDYWHPNREPEDNYQYIYKKELIKSFQLLLYCRDAYWKIIGEETGLDKPWEPDWTSSKPFYCISVNANTIGKGRWYTDNKILAFPTEEMRDTFYKNFKDLIEQCKELL